MFSQVCTVFCFEKNNDGLILYPRCLSGISWYAKTASAMPAYREAILQGQDQVFVNLPLSLDACGRSYISYQKFLHQQDKSPFWTLQLDAVVLLGDWEDYTLSLPQNVSPSLASVRSLAPPGDAFTVRGMLLSPVGSPAVAHRRIWGN